MEHYSPLRYPGGKGKIADFIKKVFEKNLLSGGVYVEPYAGGSSVALSLLMEEYASTVIINDFDRSIFAFWFAVINETEELCSKIENAELNMKVWREQKLVQQNKKNADLLELGFSTFFLNRTNRSGIINAGVIGGNDQLGNYKMNARFNKIDLISRIKRVAEYRDRIQLYNLDAIELIKTISSRLPYKSLIYFDPPYYVKGKDLYVNHYKHDDHLLVSQMINGLVQHKWLVSYDNTPEIKKLYKGNRKFEYLLHYSAVNSSKGTEVMFYQPTLYIPKNIRPLNV